MTTTNVTPTQETNEPANTQQPIDNMGNPVDADGNPVEAKEKQEEGNETLESLQKALKDTKAELTRLQQEKGDEKKEEPKDNKSLEIDNTDKTKEEAEKAGVDFNKYAEEYNKSGELSEDSYKELMSKGFDKQVVDDYIAGQKARADKQTAEVSKIVGGEEQLDTVLKWASTNLTPQEISVYNQAVQQGTDAAKLALRAVYSKYQEENGKSPHLVSGGSPSSASDIYKSPYEMQKAMEDKRYWNDPDYQKEVTEKIRRSAKAGTV